MRCGKGLSGGVELCNQLLVQMTHTNNALLHRHKAVATAQMHSRLLQGWAWRPTWSAR